MPSLLPSRAFVCGNSYLQPCWLLELLSRFAPDVVGIRCFSPKILLATFIGSQVAELSDGTHRANLSTGAQIFDIFSVVLSFGIAFGTGWYVIVLSDLVPVRDINCFA